MGLSQIDHKVKTGRTCWSRIFYCSKKRHTWGCFEEGTGYVSTVLERPIERLLTIGAQGRPQLSDMGGGGWGVKRLNPPAAQRGSGTLWPFPLEGPERLSNRIGGTRDAFIKTESVVLLGPGTLLTTGQAVLEWTGRLLTTEPTLPEGLIWRPAMLEGAERQLKTWSSSAGGAREAVSNSSSGGRGDREAIDNSGSIAGWAREATEETVLQGQWCY